MEIVEVAVEVRGGKLRYGKAAGKVEVTGEMVREWLPRSEVV